MAQAKKKSQEVAEKKDQLPAELAEELLADAGVGQEDMTADDMTIPRLRILQALSPVCVKADAEYIKGAEPGQFMDNVDMTPIDGEEGLVVIPLTYRKTYLEWYKRNSKEGKGLIKDHGGDVSILKDCQPDDKGVPTTKEGTSIIATAEYFVFVVNPETGTFQPMVISMSSTQLRNSRRWNTRINQLQIQRPNGEGTFNPAMFYRSYKLTTVPESNDNGSWFGFKIDLGEYTTALPNGIGLYRAAKDFREKVLAGAVKVVEETESAGESTEDNDSPM